MYLGVVQLHQEHIWCQEKAVEVLVRVSFFSERVKALLEQTEAKITLIAAKENTQDDLLASIITA